MLSKLSRSGGDDNLRITSICSSVQMSHKLRILSLLFLYFCSSHFCDTIVRSISSRSIVVWGNFPHGPIWLRAFMARAAFTLPNNGRKILIQLPYDIRPRVWGFYALRVLIWKCSRGDFSPLLSPPIFLYNTFVMKRFWNFHFSFEIVGKDEGKEPTGSASLGRHQRVRFEAGWKDKRNSENLASDDSQTLGGLAQRFHFGFRWLSGSVLLGANERRRANLAIDFRIHWHHFET